MSLITIDQLLESVDLDFEPRWVTQDKYNSVRIWGDTKLKQTRCGWEASVPVPVSFYPNLKLTEFSDKPWTKCIYEVPRKTTGKIKKLECYELADKEFNPTGKFEPMCYMTLIQTINSLVDAVNELKENKGE